MSSDVKTCLPTDTVADAAKLMAEYGFSVIPVEDKDGNLVGIVTESDFIGKEVEVPHALVSLKQLFGQQFYFRDIEEIYIKSKDKPLSSVMSKAPVTISPDTPLSEVVHLMQTKNWKKLPVVENKKVVGMVTRKDIIKAFHLVNS